ncbi:uncharacterized protein DC041_0005594 [Schistosoma bovis]|uniref:Uncharacterized protein n=1 Tax=Schistosoma bovis TaxID=6184 RepID=A0A430Q2Q7_SCHBO|nr:uncharacterized protein DC041_0005594 [Schistosoma bovis]
MSSFCSQDDIFNRSYQAFNNISPLSDRFSKFLREYAKDEENDDTKSWSKIKDNCSNKNGDSLKTSLTESSSGSLNTSFLSSQEATKRSNTDNSLIKNQCTLIRNNLKLLRSQVDFLLKFNASEIEGKQSMPYSLFQKVYSSLFLVNYCRLDEYNYSTFINRFVSNLTPNALVRRDWGESALPLEMLSHGHAYIASAREVLLTAFS